MSNKMNGFKSFRLSNEVINALNKLKEEYNIDSDSEIIRKIIVEHTQSLKEKEDECSEKLEEKERELKALYIKLGELQGELNIYKQQALPRKSFWKRLFGG